ncbi:MAG: hypothetical protein KF795_00595 [Labilithrix sp.]|nr:hypothetical protein [Labilithrix sp.]
MTTSDDIVQLDAKIAAAREHEGDIARDILGHTLHRNGYTEEAPHLDYATALDLHDRALAHLRGLEQKRTALQKRIDDEARLHRELVANTAKPEIARREAAALAAFEAAFSVLADCMTYRREHHHLTTGTYATLDDNARQGIRAMAKRYGFEMRKVAT